MKPIGLGFRRVILRISRPALAGAAVLAFSAASGPAFGQTRCAQPGSITGNEAEGRRYYEMGVSAADAGDWAKAHEAFLEACRRMHHPFILANLGQAALELGMVREAARHFSQHLRENPVRDEKTPQIEAMLKRAKAKVGTLTFQAPPGAEVLVNGSPVGRAPLHDAVFVEPGLLEFVARGTGQAPVRTLRHIKAGESVEVNLIQPLEQAHPSMQPSPSGGDSAVSIPPRIPEAPGPSWQVWVPGGLAIAGFGVAAGFGIAHLAIDVPETISKDNPLLQQKADYRNVALIGGVVGLVATGVTLTVWGVRGAGSKPKAEAAVVIAPGAGGVALKGLW